MQGESHISRQVPHLLKSFQKLVKWHIVAPQVEWTLLGCSYTAGYNVCTRSEWLR